MSRNKLSPVQVRNIIKMILTTTMSYQEIADKMNYGFRTNHPKWKAGPPKTISRITINKIGLTLKNPFRKDARHAEDILDYLTENGLIWTPDGIKKIGEE